MKVKKLVNLVLAITICFSLLNFNVYAQENTKEYITINNTTLEYDMIVHVDELNGDDVTGTGSIDNPYKTLEVAVKKSITEENGYDNDYAFKLADGNYKQNLFIRSTKCTGSISVIGNGANTIVTLDKPLSANGNQATDSALCTTYYYDFVWQDLDRIYTNKNAFKKPVYFNNIAFEFKNTAFSHSYFFPGLTGAALATIPIEIEHSVVSKPTKQMIRAAGAGFTGGTSKVVSVKNSYGGFSSGYGTKDADWDKGSNIIKTTSTALDVKYNIQEDGYLNAGTDLNPDGTQSHIGVYGGPFAWNAEGGLDWSIDGSGELPEETEETEETDNMLKLLLNVNEKIQLSIHNDLIKNKDAVWTSSVSNVATVDDKGLVVAKNIGTTKIRVSNLLGDVYEDVYVLVIDEDNIDELRLATHNFVGESYRLTVGDNTQDIVWSTEDPTVAIVSSKGRVTTTGVGLTVISASTPDGKLIGTMYVRVQ